MTIEVFSPRISFSYNLNQTEENDYHQRLDSSILNSGSDFNFSIGDGFVPELPSADELFSDGKILPVEIKKQLSTTTAAAAAEQIHHSNSAIPSPPQKFTRTNSEKRRLKEFLSMCLDADEAPPPTPPVTATAKPFWQFKRSSSLNCETTKSNGLIKSLRFLTRSYSVGSALNRKPSPSSTEARKPSLSRKWSISRSSSLNSLSQRGQLKYGNGVRISPVLNLPNSSVCFSRFGSIFCSGKLKKKKT